MEYKNVLGRDLQVCNCNPITGWYRDGSCKTDPTDLGMHTVCAVMTESFLTYSKAQGNDLSTPNLQYDFQGLKPGDHWCLCASRWKEAYEDGMAPLVNLEATEESTLKIVELEILKEFNYLRIMD
tara:strand:- start:421 stop:795 length:375 start_codon:yes stop_codon:yes gene_type:complete